MKFDIITKIFWKRKMSEYLFYQIANRIIKTAWYPHRNINIDRFLFNLIKRPHG